jgi:hypothetical protein
MLPNFRSFTNKLTLISKVVHFAPVRRRILDYCAISAWFMLFPACAFGQSGPSSSAIELAKSTVAPVVCMVRDVATGTQMIRFRIIGTAFMIEKRATFVTANHVISDILAAPLKDVCLPGITFPVGGWKRDPQQTVQWFAFNAGDCKVNARFDVAVCMTAEDMVTKHPDIGFGLATISTQRPADGASIFFTGFPLQATDPITSIGAVAGYPADDGYATVIIDKNAWPGASGSPIFLSDGKTVIGMVTRTGTGEAGGLSFGIAGEKISAILTSAKEQWEQEQKASAQPPVTPAQH